MPARAAEWQGRAAPAPAPPAPTTLRVHVMGAVRHPGVYSVSTGARVQDAVDAAGGAAPGADLEAINLADFLKDGEQVHLPARARRPSPRERVAGTRATLGHLPSPGEEFTHQGLRFKVVDADRHRVNQVRITPLPGHEGLSPAGAGAAS